MFESFFKSYQPGVITLSNWAIMKDGEEYKYLWCANWGILTDQNVPLEKFRSSEKWSLIGLVDDGICVLIPGCQIKAFAKCGNAPKTQRVYEVV